MLFLEKRFVQLVNEMNRRGYTTNFTDSKIFAKFSKGFYNDYIPTDNALKINRKRIEDRSKKVLT